MKQKLESDTTFARQFQENPQAMLDSLDPDKHPKLFRLVLYIMGAALMICLIVAAVTVFLGPIKITMPDGGTHYEARTVDQFFVMIGSAAIGALAGLLVPRAE